MNSRMPRNTRDIENLFGVEDLILTRFGAQSFEKSTDDLYLKQLSGALRKHPQSLQQGFNGKQDALLKAGVTKSNADVLAKEMQQ